MSEPDVFYKVRSYGDSISKSYNPDGSVTTSMISQREDGTFDLEQTTTLHGVQIKLASAHVHELDSNDLFAAVVTKMENVQIIHGDSTT